jgi:hypothetical protein
MVSSQRTIGLDLIRRRYYALILPYVSSHLGRHERTGCIKVQSIDGW